MTIDWWTLGLQTVNVVILIWLLARFFWRPVAGMIEQRRAAAQKMLADAEAKRTEVEAGRAEIEKTRVGLAGERDAILVAANEAAEEVRSERLTATAREVEALRVSARAELDRQKAEADKIWAERASRLAVEIARRLVGRLDGPAVRAAFLDWLLADVRSLPDATRQAMIAKDARLQVVSATPLEVADQQDLSDLFAAALGARPTIVFSTDPTLIAGLELHGPNLVVANSWRADLDQILSDIERGK